MGIIRRQAIKNNLLSFVGVGVGVLSQLYIYPLNLEAKGFADGLIKFATLLYPFFTLGMGAVMVRFVPYLVAEDVREASAQLFTRGMLAVTVPLAAAALLGPLIIPWLTERGVDLGVLATHFWTVWVILACLTYAALVTTHLLNFKRIAVPVIFNNLLLKLTIPALVLLLTFRYLTVDGFLLGIVGSYLLVLLGLIVYALVLGVMRLDHRPLRYKEPEKSGRELVSTAAFAVFGLIGSSVVTNLDVVMVNTALTNTDTAVYSFCLFAAGVMAVPSTAINNITAPIVSDRWQQLDLPGLAQLYRQSSVVLTSVGMLVVVGLFVCLPYLYQITPRMAQHIPGYYPTLIIAIGFLANQITGINGTLINYTDYYRWNIVFVLLAGLVNYVLNYYFLMIAEQGLTGAAIATAWTLVLYNVSKTFFLYKKVGLHPFAGEHLSILLIGSVIGAVAYYLPPEMGNVWADLLLRAGLICLLFYLVFRYTDASPEIKTLLRQGLKSVF